MSNNSGVTDQIISLPKGGGALRGVGETFAPDLQTGTGNFTVPLSLPRGRNGFQPELRLVYSTGNGNGVFGLGWSLNVPGIARKTSKRIPKYDDQTDIFVLSGTEDLVSVATEGPTVSYRPRTEGLFARIEHHRSGTDNYWRVRTKDGLTSFYGTPRPPQPPVDWRDPAALTSPVDSEKIAAWKLSETRDSFGNRILYEYEQDRGATQGRLWNHLYLKRIQYADYVDQNGIEKFLVSVEFTYEDRPDPFSDYRTAFEVRTTKRCTRIEVRTHENVEHIARRHQFIYLDERTDIRGLDKFLPINGVSLLSQVRVVGLDGQRVEELAPLEFGYSAFEPAKRKFFPFTGADLPPVSLAHPDFELADLFGNSLPDVFEMNGTVRYWRNQGEGSFDLPKEMDRAPAGIRLADPGVQLLDANGDGRVDLLVTTPALSGYFPLRLDGQWDGRSFQRSRQAPSFDLKDPEVKLVDLNGDGVPDAIRSDVRFEIFFNDPEQGWNESRRVERRALTEFPDVIFSDPRVKWGDMSGDGLQDIALVYDGSVVYWPDLGYGNWGKPIYMHNSPRFPDGYDPKRILIGDVDGDGVADLVYVDDKKVTLWTNQSGNAWSDPIVITGTPPVSDMDAVRLVDMLGEGVAGVLWSADFSGSSRGSMFFLDFTGGTKPYLLNRMDNHIGATTLVEYASSTRFYTEDQKKPATRWRTTLPFPVQVVHRVEVIDELSRGKLTTEYRYHHGHWDGAEREFRGFGMVEQFDSEVFRIYNQDGLHGSGTQFIPVTDHRQFSPPTQAKTWFHLGPVGDEFGDWNEPDFSSEFWPYDVELLRHRQSIDDFLRTLSSRRMRRDALRALRGSILRTELYALDGTEKADRPYTITESAFGLRLEAAPADGDSPGVFFPHRLATRTTQWERGHDPLTQFVFTDTSDYDEFGQLRRSTQIACPRGWRTMNDKPELLFLATRTGTTYARPIDLNTYIFNRVARTTSFELRNDGGLSIGDLRTLSDNDSSLAVIGQSYSYYDGPAFEGLPAGQVGSHGALVRTETLVLTESILHDGYQSGDTPTNPPEEPPYLARASAPPWTGEYPSEFRAMVPPLAGYVFRPGGPEAEDARGFFTQSERCQYDFQAAGAGGLGKGLPIFRRDSLGHDTVVGYDSFQLLPVQVTDAAKLTTQAAYDYRTLQPKQIVDPNRNTTVFTYTPLGMPAEIFVQGKAGEGDRTNASVHTTYDLLAFLNSKKLDPGNPQPIFVHTTRRIHHDTETDIPASERDDTIESREYSDGFGRSLQTRSQAEDTMFGDPVFGDGVVPSDQSDRAGTMRDVAGRRRGPADLPNVVVSGLQLYDNKGQVVEKFEPFFSVGYDYAPPADAQLGEKVEMFYDPRGHLVRTVNPDGSEQVVVFGVPGTIATPDLSDPEVFEPTPWEAYTYDANDNAGRTHPAAAAAYRHHWDTPASILVDALGRTIVSTERNRQAPANPGGPLPPIEEIVTRSAYDIRGNVLTVTDALARVAFMHVYDFANRPLRVDSIDAGTRRTIADAAGNTIEHRDRKGALILRAYEVLDRSTHLWARDVVLERVTLRERMVYGDDPGAGLSARQIEQGNLLGRLYRHYDEAGRLSFTQYDFKANLLEKERRVIGTKEVLSVFTGPPANWDVKAFRTDWAPSGGSSPSALEARAAILLDAASYQTSSMFDALNRSKLLVCPTDVEGGRKELRPRYNRAGVLEQVTLDGATYVDRIVYTAKGQRSLIAYGNGVMTRYAYDTTTFRLARIRTEGFSQLERLTYRPAGDVFQDFAYEYDLAGNILRIHDRAPASGIPNTTSGTEALDRDFSYDAIYRLLSANGRECDRPPDLPWDDSLRCTDLTRTRAYSETYRYDNVGNIRQLQHGANRDFTLVAGTDRLAAMVIGRTTYAYTYDLSGNMTQETTSRHFEWDHSNSMRVFRTQTAKAEPSVYAHYLYDSVGQRVIKLVRKQGGQVEVTLCLDGIFEYQQIVKGRSIQENNTLHVMDNQGRVAVVRIGQAFTNDVTPAVKYHLSDHLGSGNVVVGGTEANARNFVNREEYTPYGETSFGAFGRKRYGFGGKERDEESGLRYFGARYYAPWTGRWVSPDPLAISAPMGDENLYGYVHGRPLIARDPIGLQDNLTTTNDPYGNDSPPGGAPPQTEPTPESSPTPSPESNAAETAPAAGAANGNKASFKQLQEEGAEAHNSLAEKMEAKGHGLRREVYSRGGRGGSRHDIVPDPKAPQTFKNVIESKSIDLDRYRDPDTGALDTGQVRSKINEDLVQVIKHNKSLETTVKADMPTDEVVVYTPRNATTAEAVQLRTILREELKPLGLRGGVRQPTPPAPGTGEAPVGAGSGAAVPAGSVLSSVLWKMAAGYTSVLGFGLHLLAIHSFAQDIRVHVFGASDPGEVTHTDMFGTTRVKLPGDLWVPESHFNY